MATKPKQLGAIHREIVELLKKTPEGLTIYEIRDQLVDPGVQQHLDKRVRELRAQYDVLSRKKGGQTRYVLVGDRADAAPDSGRVSKKLRAAVFHKAHGRCQMCGRTVHEDGIKLEADHKIPRNWGGATTEENLWALCQLCNGGKRDYFASFNDEIMKQIMSKESVYERIAETLRLHLGNATPSWLLEFVANSDDWQEDWHKRLRELRYPPIGLKIRATRSRTPSGRVQSAYTLEEWRDLPPDHKALIKEHERRIKASPPPSADD